MVTQTAPFGQPVTAPLSTAKVVEFSRIETRDHQGKTIWLNADGTLGKEPPHPVFEGQVYRERVCDAVELGQCLTNCQNNAVLVAGRMPGDALDGVRIQTVAKAQPGSLTRTADTFTYDASRPALGVFDIDMKPDAELQVKIAQAGGPRSAIVAAVPVLGRIEGVWVQSASSGVMRWDTGERFGTSGLHLYALATSPIGLQEFAKRVDQRLKLAGLGFAFISKAGTIFPRSPIDLSASCHPARLVYRAPALFTDKRLRYTPRAREPIVQRGPWLDPQRDLPPLTPDEERQVGQIEADLIRQAEPKAQAIREAHKRKYGFRSGGHVTYAAGKLPIIEIDGRHPLHLDDGRTLTVLDLLLEVAADPDRFRAVKCKLADPLEPDYGAGRNLAFVRVNDAGHIDIFSHAHGGQIFRFALSAADFGIERP